MRRRLCRVRHRVCLRCCSACGRPAQFLVHEVFVAHIDPIGIGAGAGSRAVHASSSPMGQRLRGPRCTMCALRCRGRPPSGWSVRRGCVIVMAGGAARLARLRLPTVGWRHLGRVGAAGALGAASSKEALLPGPPQSWGRVREASRREGGVRWGSGLPLLSVWCRARPFGS